MISFVRFLTDKFGVDLHAYCSLIRIHTIHTYVQENTVSVILL